jgi:exosortase
MLSIVIWWIGAFILCFGIKISQSFQFPLLFLFGLIPIPVFALNEIIKLLQQGSALAARMLFAIAGVPVVQNGVMLTIPGLTIEVAKECSSIRSSSMLLVTTMVLAQLLLKSPWRKTLVIVVAVPLSIGKNGLRIFTITMLGTRVDPVFMTGSFHHQGGILFFLISLAFEGLLLWTLRRNENHWAH